MSVGLFCKVRVNLIKSCAACGELFNSSHAFEKHRHGDHGIDRRCMTEAEMVAKGMHKGADNFWRGSAMPERMYGDAA